MNQNSREQVISADLNRIGNLAGRELMDAALARSVRADFYQPSNNSFDDFSSGHQNGAAVPMAGLTIVPSLDGIASSFDMNIGAGEGHLPAGTLDPDMSSNELLRWPAQRITWPSGGTPDPTNPIICLIVATPADVLSDEASRNILVDPSTRATVPQNVFKTSNPVANISVVVGTAAASPVAPTVPTGALALFEVYVPALAANSTAFRLTRRAYRLIEFPGTSQHGILHGCVPFLSNTPNGISAGAHRIVIDGELLSFNNPGLIPLTDDGSHAPGSAPGGNDMPTYLYLCGGRNYPVSRNTSVALGRVPVYLIESLTPPDEFGYPTATLTVGSPSLTFPRSACCYIGLKFRGASNAANVPSFYDGDWIYSLNTISGILGFLTGAAVNPTTSFAAYTLAGTPANSTAVDLRILCSGVGEQYIVSLTNSTGGEIGSVQIPPLGGSPVTGDMQFGTWTQKLPIIPGSPMSVYVKSIAGTGTLVLAASGYNMNIPRLAR
jgi:hypothetical protein